MNIDIKTLIRDGLIIFVVVIIDAIVVEKIKGWNPLDFFGKHETATGISTEAQNKLDSMQNEINKRDVKIGILNYRDSTLQADYDELEYEKTPVRNNIVQKEKQYHDMPEADKDSTFKKKYKEYFP